MYSRTARIFDAEDDCFWAKRRRSEVIKQTLVLALLLSLAACGGSDGNTSSGGGTSSTSSTATGGNGGDSKYPEYLDLGSLKPIIKDEFKGQVIPDVMIITSVSESGDYEKSWLKQYLENVMNVQMNVEQALGESCGGVLSVGFEKVFLLQNALDLSRSQVISTYTYEMGIVSGQFSDSSAIGLFNTIINVILLGIVNTISKKIADVSII